MKGMSALRPPSSVADTLRDFWRTRPVRPRRGRKLAGVSAAISNRYGIDPLLVRIAFVIAALYGGSGFMLYLLGWLLLPKEGTPETGGRPRPTSVGAAVVLLLMLMPASFSLFSSSGLLGFLLASVTLYLLHRHCADRPSSALPARAAPPGEVTPTGENTWVFPGANAESAGQQRTPPSWDPLGAAPFAWDLPDPAPVEQPEPQRPLRRWIAPLTLAAATFLSLIGLVFLGVSFETALAFALGVLGLGMVAGAFLGGGRGLIWLAVPLAALLLIIDTPNLVNRWDSSQEQAEAPSWIEDGGRFWDDIGDRELQPTTVGGIAPRYETRAGNLVLDLTEVDFTDEERASTVLRTEYGNLTVRVPDTVDVIAHCSTDAGTARCLDEEVQGPVQNQTVQDFGDDGPGGGSIELELHAGAGDVEVYRE